MIFCKPSHKLLRNKDIYKNKNCPKGHKGTGYGNRAFYTQNAFTNNQCVDRQANQACNAGRNIAAVDTYLDQVNEKVKVTA